MNFSLKQSLGLIGGKRGGGSANDNYVLMK